MYDIKEKELSADEVYAPSDGDLGELTASNGDARDAPAL